MIFRELAHRYLEEYAGLRISDGTRELISFCETGERKHTLLGDWGILSMLANRKVESAITRMTGRKKVLEIVLSSQ